MRTTYKSTVILQCFHGFLFNYSSTNFITNFATMLPSWLYSLI